jgi:hypothetical protein
MYAKINGGTVEKFPYTFGDLRKEHPNVSFPKNITQGVMQKYGMVGVLEGPKPETGPYQTVKRNSIPTRPVIGQYTEEDAPLPEMVGEDIIAGYWMIEYTAVDMFSDYTDEDGVTHTKAEQEAAYQAGLDAAAAKAVRDQRERLLAETDWVTIKAVDASNDGFAVQLPQVWVAYRQALRDITDHVNFPYLTGEDWPVAP